MNVLTENHGAMRGQMRRIVMVVMALMVVGTCHVSAQEDDEYEKNDWSLQVGYVNKQWISKVNGQTMREDMWGKRNRFLHGIQVGGVYTPTLRSGLGAYTGLLMEAYLSSSKVMGYDNFTEVSLYVPAHLNFNVRLSPKVSINTHAGLGLNWAVHGGFTNHDSWYWDYDSYGMVYQHFYEVDHIRYGKYGWPKAYNVQAEWSVGVRVDRVLVSMSYSFGLIDHRLYKDVKGSDTRQDKMSLTVGIEM